MGEIENKKITEEDYNFTLLIKQIPKEYKTEIEYTLNGMIALAEIMQTKEKN